MPADIGTVERFAELLLARRVHQRHFGALDNRHIRTTGLLQTPQRKHRRRFHPLIAAHGGDAEQVNLWGAEQHQQR